MGDSMDYEELRAEVMANPDARRAYERNRAERAVLAAAKAWKLAADQATDDADIARAKLYDATKALLALEEKGGAS